MSVLLSLAVAGAGRVPCTARVQPAAGSRRLPASRQQRVSPVQRALLPSSTLSSAKDAEGITVPVTYAELLGLQDVQLPLQPAVERAYEDLMNTPLEEGYSELARLGKEKLLFAARDRLHGVRGRTALLSPSVQVEPLLLPGAMALLHQLKQYDMVIQLSEEGAGLGARQIRASSRDTLREIEQDMALSTALAQCGLADRALKEGKPALACTRLQEALQLLVDASHTVSGDGSGLLPGTRAGPAHQQRLLAPQLQVDIEAALAQYHPDAVADYLQIPLERSDYTLRLRELAALQQWVAAPAAGQRRDQRPVITPEYMAGVVPCLTAGELCSLYDWQRLAAGGNSARCPWYFPGLLKRAALAHLVAGFVERQPLLIRTALRLFNTIRKDDDVALSLAMCQLLLGDTTGSLQVLEEDDRAQQQLLHKAKGLPAVAGGIGAPYGGNRAPGLCAGPKARHAVMQFIRAHSPQGVADLRLGLAAFATWWLAEVAYPEFQDTALGAVPPPDLVSYFEDSQVQDFLSSQDGKPGSGVRGMLAQAQASILSRFGSVATAEAPASSSSSSLEQQLSAVAVLLRRALQLFAGVMALGAALLVASRLRSGGWGSGIAGLLQPPTAASLSAEAAAAADIGLPAEAVRLLLPWEQQQEQQAPTQHLQQQQEQQPAVQVLSKSAAAKIIKDWLSVKAEAMGKHHNMARLAQVLEEPMLSAVASEAAEAGASGWYWAIRPHKCKIDSLDASSFSAADGSGHISVLATVDESAQLWGAHGEQGESYKTPYQVEYMLVCSGGTWKIASALVLGS